MEKHSSPPSTRPTAAHCQPAESNGLAVDDAATLLETMLAVHEERVQQEQPQLRVAKRIDGVVVGSLVALSNEGEALVTFAACPGAQRLPAVVAIQLRQQDVGKQVALLFAAGDPTRPIVIGLLMSGLCPDADQSTCHQRLLARKPAITADGQSVQISAERDIVLRCGKASLTLTRAGKILLRGAYVSTRSSGVNRVQGASVQIN